MDAVNCDSIRQKLDTASTTFFLFVLLTGQASHVSVAGVLTDIAFEVFEEGQWSQVNLLLVEISLLNIMYSIPTVHMCVICSYSY